MNHRTPIANLYAAGEAACQYHGANRLGGNSLLGAMYGGRTAADSAMKDLSGQTSSFRPDEKIMAPTYWTKDKKEGLHIPVARKALNRILQKSLGIERDEKGLLLGLSEVQELRAAVGGLYDESATIDENDAFPEIPSPCGSDFEKRTEPKRKPRRPHEKRLSR